MITQERHEMPRRNDNEIDNAEDIGYMCQKVRREPYREEQKQWSKALMRERTKYMNKHYKNYKK